MASRVAVADGVTPNATDVDSQRRLARVAGVFYLILALCGGFSELVVRNGLRVPGDFAATTRNIADSAALGLAGFGADLVSITCFLLLGLALSTLFRHVDVPAAVSLLTFIAVSVAVMSVNMLNHLAALLTATDSAYTSAFGAEAAETLPAVFLEFHSYGYTIASIFFGLWLLPLGYLGLKSGLLPRWLSVLAIAACFSYLAGVPLAFANAPELPLEILALVSSAGELSLIAYLLVKGVRVPRA
jgi:hypothetical protein